MENRIRIYNDMKYNIGLITQRGIAQNIRPGSFQTFDREDVEYFVAIAKKLFDEPHQLRIADEEAKVTLGISDEEGMSSDKESIIAQLKMSPKKIEEWLAKINQEHMLSLIHDIAIEIDLPASKMRILKEKMPNLFED